MSALTVEGLGAAVTWAPGFEPADFFRVYGLDIQGDLTLLETTAAHPSATVPPGFHAYAVSGVRAGVESRLVYSAAQSSSPGGCGMVLSTDPPGVSLWGCPSPGSKMRLAAKVLLP